MNPLFAYGTLMCPDIMQAVAGKAFKGVKATLKEYRRLTVKNQHYPGLTPHAGGSVEGIVYFDVSAASWQRLDLFEGDMYSLDLVELELVDGSIISANTYVVKEVYRKNLTETDWDFEKFLREGKREFIGSYNGYNDLDS